MLFRLGLIPALALALLAGSGAPAAAEPVVPLVVTATPMAAVNATHPTTQLLLSTNRSGTYDLTWQLRTSSGNQPVDGGSGAVTGEQLAPDGSTVPAEIDGTDLPPNSYRVIGMLTLHDPEAGEEYFSLDFSTPHTTFVVDRQIPQVGTVQVYGQNTNTQTTRIWPNVRTADRPGGAVLTFTRDDVSRIEVRNANGALVRSNILGWTALWDGKNEAGVVVPSGTYFFSFFDAAGNQAETVAHVYVDARRRVLRTWQRAFTPRRTLVDRYVGRCSTLRRPAARGWAGSFGFYANTRCRRQTWRASAVSTMHGVYLPRADAYVSVQVNVWGGAAKARPRSRAALRYYGAEGRWRGWQRLDPYLGAHKGHRATKETNVVRADRAFFWGMASAYGARYDVKTFTVTARYWVLV